ncbi:MAG: 1,6-anhydro-N-acetylmuramyl-L-alanine amidase AmpD [Comamonas sp.]
MPRASTTPVPSPSGPSPHPVWHGGWLWPCLHEHSPNHGPRPPDTAIDLLVVHSISLPPGEYGGDAVRQLFTNTLPWHAHPYYEGIRGIEVSAHFFIRRNGAIWQFVDADRRAWHAGASAYRGRANCNDYAIGVELEGLEGLDFEAPQYDALGWLCLALRQRYPLRHVTSHSNIAPGRKRDPGPGFDWPRLQALTHSAGLQIDP